MSQPDFRVLLRRFRMATGLSQEALAEQAGLSRNAVSALERGARTQPYAHTVQALATALDLDDQDRAQLVAAARPSAPVPAELPTVPTVLASIIGRDTEIAAIQRLLENTQLLTLTGVGGVGKSRLVLEVAQRFGPNYTDGVVFVSLAPLSDATLVVPTIAARLGIRDQGNNLFQALQQELRPKHLLLVLDNFEHVLHAAADVAELLGACPMLRIITTSRAPLRIQGELEFPVRPLAVSPSTQPLTSPQIEALPAAQVFLRQARAVNPEFALTHGHAATILAICRRLDGIPLALQLAAAWIRVLSPQELLERLDHALPVLIGGPRDLPERHQTMRDTIAWSYQLLDPSEQIVFCRLSVFAGGWTLAMVEALVGQAEALPLLGHLVEHSLVIVEALPNRRYRMLEPIRQYGLEQLEAQGRAAQAHNDQAAFMMRLAESAELELHGPHATRVIEQLGQEQDNIRAALRWWLSQNALEQAALLAGAVWLWWEQRGFLSEGSHWLGQMYPHAAALPADVRAKLLFGLGRFAHNQGEYIQAAAFLEESLAIVEQGDNGEQSMLLLSELGVIAHKCGEYDRAVALQTQALAKARARKDTYTIGKLVNNLGWAALWHGDSEQAVRLLEEAVALARQTPDSPGMMAALNSLAIALTRQGEYPRAEALFHESVALAWEVGHQRNLAYNLGGLAELAAASGHTERAARLWGADDALRERMKYVRPPVERVTYADQVSEAQAAIGADAFRAAWTEGRAMTLEQAVGYALKPTQ